MNPPPSTDPARDLTAWREAAADLAFTSAFATSDGGAEHVLALAALLGSHPATALPADLGAVQKLTEAGGDAAAALALVEPLAGYMLSCAPGGRHMATIVLAGQADEHHAEGASAALALVGALAAALAGPAACSSVSDLQFRTGDQLRLN